MADLPMAQANPTRPRRTQPGGAERTVDWLGVAGERYEPIEPSRLIEVGPKDLAEPIDWP